MVKAAGVSVVPDGSAWIDGNSYCHPLMTRKRLASGFLDHPTSKNCCPSLSWPENCKGLLAYLKMLS